ncbi:MAG: YihA family ribosome biogenesis GTP-binding protein [Alphaproteobacteria bacterium]|nr:YihA family ribosome biogenesis GTP-binding protein [Alphaproteobacteria bacterium]
MSVGAPFAGDPAAIEQGRRLFAADSRFAAAADRAAALPAERLPEVAFFGRSNVGKSSLLNALTGRRGLARVSRTPGRTRAINFFAVGDRLTLVDLPGYGYAAVARAEARRWGETVKSYLARRGVLKGATLLIDARHGLKESDRLALDLLAHYAVSVLTVLTKADKLAPAERSAQIAATAAALARYPNVFPAVLATSAATGFGIPELRALLATLAS